MQTNQRWRLSIATRLAAFVSLLLVLTISGAMALAYLLPGYLVMIGVLVLLVMVPVVFIAVRSQFDPMFAMFRALGGTAVSYRDGDYSFGLHWQRNDEIGDLVAAHNDLGNVLRDQRLDLIQRELLLDSMVQNTPVAMLLVADRGAIVFANLAARQLLSQGRKLEGHSLQQIVASAADSLREALDRGGDGLFSVTRNSNNDGSDDEDEIYHLARRHFTLNGRRHELLLLRHLTIELRRQEVQTWKKVIRVISHELNNSLAPVASLANSGVELLRRGKPDRLMEILQTIADRTRHLEQFITGYAQFAKLPAPRAEWITCANFVDSLRSQIPFTVVGTLPEEAVGFDIAQMEQALLNLFKNAHESGSEPEHVCLSIRRLPDAILVEVTDRGSGMSETVMSNALVPFYSTKRSGTGLGLALAREIIEAHGGRISINNREAGGLSVSLILPLNSAPNPGSKGMRPDCSFD
ncbi:MAG: ATP-binding protein [Betaproteobacteria bacterium]